jgi:hypothetical protein
MEPQSGIVYITDGILHSTAEGAGESYFPATSTAIGVCVCIVVKIDRAKPRNIPARSIIAKPTKNKARRPTSGVLAYP